MKRVTGLGGMFFKARDTQVTLDWYRDRLGIDSAEWGGFPFTWLEREQPTEVGYTVWSVFPESTDHIPSDQSFMMNFRVADLTALAEALKAEGVEFLSEVEEHPNGKFAWILDPEGRKVELWEPIASKDDPYI